MRKLEVFIFCCIFELILCTVLFDYSEIVAIVKMYAIIKKETAFIMPKIILTTSVLRGFC